MKNIFEDDTRHSEIRCDNHSYFLLQEGIGYGSYTSVDLYKRLNKAGTTVEVFVIKSFLSKQMRNTQCPVYGPEGLISIQTIRWQLNRELEILQSLRGKSKNIISIEEVLEYDECVRIVYPYCGEPIMRFVDGLDGYSANIDHDSPEDGLAVLTVNDTRESLKQILSALSYVHEIRVCHKDIKPENLLMRNSLSEWLIRRGDKVDSQVVGVKNKSRGSIHLTLCDFNISEYVSAEGCIYDAQGTLHFSPPEVFARSLSDDPHIGVDGFARDIWSVGIFGYVMLCGVLPIKGKSALEIQLKLIDLATNGDEFPDWSCRESDPDFRLLDLINQMLYTDPTKRPSAKEALELLTKTVI
jgi:serine/threonine protein kinase